MIMYSTEGGMDIETVAENTPHLIHTLDICPDTGLTDSKKAEWVTYRKSLRDLPANTSDPANPTWPTKPS